MGGRLRGVAPTILPLQAVPPPLHKEGVMRTLVKKLLTSKLGNGIISLQRKLGKEVVFMNKQEILQRSRMENDGKEDEREQNISNRSFRLAFVVLAMVLLLFSFVERHYLNDSLSFYIFQTGYTLAFSVQQLYVFFRTKKKSSLVAGIVLAFGTVVFGVIVFDQLMSRIAEYIPPAM